MCSIESPTTFGNSTRWPLHHQKAIAGLSIAFVWSCQTQGMNASTSVRGRRIHASSTTDRTSAAMAPRGAGSRVAAPVLRLLLTRSLQIDCHSLADEIFQRGFIDGLSFVDIDGAPDVPLQARVEETRRVFERRSLGE